MTHFIEIFTVVQTDPTEPPRYACIYNLNSLSGAALFNRRVYGDRNAVQYIDHQPMWPLNGIWNLASVMEKMKCQFYLILINWNWSSHILPTTIIDCLFKKCFQNLLRESLNLIKEIKPAWSFSGGGAGCIPDLFLLWS